MVTEMEELMSGYIMEMKEENEALLKKVAHKNQPPGNQDGKNKASIPKETAVLLKEINPFEEQNRTNLLYSTKNKAAEAYKSQSPTKQKIREESMLLADDSLELSAVTEKTAKEPENATFYETLQASLNGQSVEKPSLHEQVNALKKQGLSTEEIAQTLKRGKTEIELLLKFQNEK